MGEAKLKLSATKRLISDHPHCYFCGGRREATTREHMPPKALFDNSHRPDRLVMPACQECNRDTSTADLVAAIVSRWHYDSNEKALNDHKRLIRQAYIQHPSLIREWTKSGPVARKKARQHLRDHGVPVPDDAGLATIGPETIKFLNLFAHKAVLALYFEHYRKPLPRTGGLAAYWKRYEDFASHGVPAFLFDMLPEWATIAQGKWDERETFQYRYAKNESDGLFGCLAKLRGGLFVVGFAATDAQILSEHDGRNDDWVSPDDPTKLMELLRFERK